MGEHLGDGRRRQAGGRGELAGGQLAALIELEEQLELGVAELGRPGACRARAGG